MLTVEKRKINDITPYSRNNKIHPEEQIEKLIESIKKYGFTNPIQVDKNGVIIAGHGRYMASVKMGLKTVPVIVRDDLTEQQVRAYRIADNRLADSEFAPYDLEKVQVEINTMENTEEKKFIMDLFPQIQFEDGGPGGDGYGKSQVDSNFDFKANDIKQVQLQYTSEEYGKLTERLDQLMTEEMATNYSELLYKIVLSHANSNT